MVVATKKLDELDGELEIVAKGLYLHKLSDENPIIITMTVPSNWNTQLLKEKDLYKFYYYKEELWEMGKKKLNLHLDI